jgi:hypothetical protein
VSEEVIVVVDVVVVVIPEQHSLGIVVRWDIDGSHARVFRRRVPESIPKSLYGYGVLVKVVDLADLPSRLTSLTKSEFPSRLLESRFVFSRRVRFEMCVSGRIVVVVLVVVVVVGGGIVRSREWIRCWTFAVFL